MIIMAASSENLPSSPLSDIALLTDETGPRSANLDLQNEDHISNNSTQTDRKIATHKSPSASSPDGNENKEAKETETGQVCIACGDNTPLSTLTIAGCGHGYCPFCIDELFRLAIWDESLFPPRCCHNDIPFPDAGLFLTEGLAERFEKRTEEMNSTNRTYCYATYCCEFIPRERIDGDRATCSACANVTCTICKSSAHDSDCPKDPTLDLLMATAMQAGYQQCYHCHRLIELDAGCNHIM